MERPLDGTKIAVILLAANPEASIKVCNYLHEQGADLVAITLTTDGVPGGLEAAKAVNIQLADSSGYRALVMIADEGGVTHFRNVKGGGKFVRDFFDEGKPVSAMGDAVMILSDLGLLSKRAVSSEDMYHMELKDNQADVVETSMHTDQGLTTATWRTDPIEFAKKVQEETLEGRHQGQHV